MDLAICSNSCKDCGREGRPRYVPNHTVEVKGEHWISVEGGREEEEGRRRKGRGGGKKGGGGKKEAERGGDGERRGEGGGDEGGTKQCSMQSICMWLKRNCIS